MSNYLQEFGEHVKELRIKSGFVSQRSLSEKLGVSNSTIAKIERGVHEPTEETVEKLAEAFNVDFNDLLERKNQALGLDEERLSDKLDKLNRNQLNIITNMVDEFLRLGGKL